MLRNAGGGGGINFSGKKRYEDVRFNTISITRGVCGVQFPEKKCYITLEWPHMPSLLLLLSLHNYRVRACRRTPCTGPDRPAFDSIR